MFGTGSVLARVALPPGPVPEGRMVELPGRGATFLTDTPGPTPDAPTLLLLHALSCTGLLTWWPAVAPLSEHYRVVTFDQRWHGRGIASERFSLVDCADDAAAVMDLLGLDRAFVAGYSMGSIIAQRVWRQHPERVQGLVLGATTDHFRSTFLERMVHPSMEIAMWGARGRSVARTALAVGRGVADADEAPLDSIHRWALAEFRRTSPWATAQAVAALGRHHSRPWISKIDVPTAVIVLGRDRIIPTVRQYALARRIPAATVHEVDAGHGAVVIEWDKFRPALMEAMATVVARARVAR